MGKASRRKHLKRAGLLAETPTRQPACACHMHEPKVIEVVLQDLPEDIQHNIQDELAAWAEDEDEQEAERAVVRVWKEVDCEGNPLSYGVRFNDGEGVSWSA